MWLPSLKARRTETFFEMLKEFLLLYPQRLGSRQWLYVVLQSMRLLNANRAIYEDDRFDAGWESRFFMATLRLWRRRTNLLFWAYLTMQERGRIACLCLYTYAESHEISLASTALAEGLEDVSPYHVPTPSLDTGTPTSATSSSD